MEAICSSETSVDAQRTTRCYIPEDGTLHNHRCENLKSYSVVGDSGSIFGHSVFPFSLSIPALGFNYPPPPPLTAYLGWCPSCEAYCCPARGEVKSVWSFMSTPPVRLYGVVFRHTKAIFTFTWYFYCNCCTENNLKMLSRTQYKTMPIMRKYR
jgi:hypothetical protein